MRPSRRTSAPVSFVESLESRALFAADLTVLSASTTNLAGVGNKTGSLVIKNTGTVPMSGPVTVTFIATAAGKPNQTLGTTNITLAGLKPNSAKPVTGVKISAPTNSSSASTKFNIVATITPHTNPVDTSAGNNSKAAGTVTIGSISAGPAVSPFAIQGAGSKLKFKLAKKLPGNGVLGSISERGTFTDGNGHTGTYSFVLPSTNVGNKKDAQFIDLDFKSSPGFAGGQRRYHLTFTPASKRLSMGLNGKTITFTAAAAGTSAKGEAFGTVSPNLYLKY